MLVNDTKEICAARFDTTFQLHDVLRQVRMALIKLLLASIRRVANFPLVQLAITVVVILWLQAADSSSVFGELFTALDWLVDFTVRRCAAIFEVRSFTKSWLTTGFMIAYVYLAGLVILFFAKVVIRAAVELVARTNAFGLTNAIARERGIAAYQAWLPLERIRPAHIPQEKWEERFAWPANNKPPYPPFTQRAVRGVVTFLAVLLIFAGLLQAFTPVPALTWLYKTAEVLVMSVSHYWVPIRN
ncbi:MAG: hypothetical protein DME65_02815 [Verrucomicrobia bacterium]|nr:MAG: hypothetical protein DME65_02815 [Verrucomicrobiota bacterium]